MSDDILARIAALDEEPAADTEIVEGEPPVDPSGDTPPVDAPPVEEDPKLLAGKYKTAEDLEAAYKAAERKMHEESQRAREYEQQLAELQQPAAPVIPLMGQPTSMEELQQLAYEQPEAAVEFAALQAPHTMPYVLAAVRQYDSVRAEVLTEWYNDFKMEQRLSQATKPIEEMRNQATAHDAWQQIASRPGYQELREDIAAVVAERAHWFNTQDPKQIAAALSDAFDIAAARNPGKVQQIAADAAAARGAAATAHTEQGGHGAREVDPEVSPEDEIRDSIFAKSKSMSW